MRRLDSGVLQHDFVHTERMQALVHARDGILRLISRRPARIENTVQARGIYARRLRGVCCLNRADVFRSISNLNRADEQSKNKQKYSAQKRGEWLPGCEPRDGHTRNINTFWTIRISENLQHHQKKVFSIYDFIP